MAVDHTRETVPYNVWRSLDRITEYHLATVDLPVQPAAAVHLCTYGILALAVRLPNRELNVEVMRPTSGWLTFHKIKNA
jgi:hypothetical protein